MKQCQKCQLDISEQASFCERCGTQTKALRQFSPKGRALGGLVTLVFSAVVVYLLWTHFGAYFQDLGRQVERESLRRRGIHTAEDARAALDQLDAKWLADNMGLTPQEALKWVAEGFGPSRHAHP